MKKTYKANTNVSINVVLANKKNLHITFVPLSNGSSVFTTDNEELQTAIERHHNYGKLFKVKKESPPPAVHPAPLPKEGREEEEKGERKKVTVSDINEAKDYLAEKFGVSRTLMRSTKSIQEQASAHGVEFVY